MKKILIIEDEKEIIKLLKYNLEKEGYSVKSAQDGESGLEVFKKEKPELVILDLMLPKLSGIEVCKRIRMESKIPVIMLTAKKEETDRVLGLELGADDYVTKPFSTRELLARVKSLFRRLDQTQEQGGIVRLGKLELDMDKYEARVSGQAVAFTTKEFTFLKILLEKKGKALNREFLLESVWGYEKGLEIDTRTIDQHVARIRNKLKSESGRIITVKNIGYRIKMD